MKVVKSRANKINISHFDDGGFDLQHPLSYQLPDPLLPGQRRLVLMPSLLLARLLFGFHLYSKKNLQIKLIKINEKNGT